MESANSSTQTVEGSGRKRPEPRSIMLSVQIYDISSVQERLLRGAAATTNPPETVDGTAAGSTRLDVLKNKIIDLDLILGTSFQIPSRL
ncbi:unnamed protein product [Fusarium graminearum]|uniref:Chromosome 2, complete genome n=2 Tax=Gibberella zeae TaxID=5518 RepID=A0A0E0S7C6_GIBZE|nr:hypothetical protein FG05_30451 [Fusarium graminearum]KAI6773393.1 hypothetical protein HG531_000242 [Fusarium graminearum]PCD28295.1 hypothetical protein FGRA07_03434 [Fusarium graminearum]CAF3516376.1 unnamed protein product [Fusarium graminearum]CAF3537180.1 unnamed protein product [Fusarium graminearum]